MNLPLSQMVELSILHCSSKGIDKRLLMDELANLKITIESFDLEFRRLISTDRSFQIALVEHYNAHPAIVPNQNKYMFDFRTSPVYSPPSFRELMVEVERERVKNLSL